MRKLHKSSYYRILVVLLVTAMLGGLLPFTQVASAQTTPTPQPNTADRELKRSDTSERALNKNAQVSPSLAKATGRIPVMVQLVDEPAAVVYAQGKAQSGDSPQLANATRNQISKINAAQTAVLNELNSLNLKSTQVLYQVDKAYNGIALMTDASNVAALAKLQGVKKVTRLATLERSNAFSVPFIGTPTAWQSFGITGTNVKIGVIDTGIDYYHTNFGGPGTVRTTRDQFVDTVITDTPGLFPGPKVAGGFDFAGDDYNADDTDVDYNPIPSPDPDPVDCPSVLGGGHGSHVSGTAAGYGVNANGTTYTGAYNTSTPFSTMRIGPGVAPGAKLYGLRVFGCTGSTNLDILAINWTLDPNGDNDFSDKLDVVNQSLGSDYGQQDNPSAEATNNAAAAGILMVVSAGNAGDVSYISGSPASSVRSITVASTVDAGTVTDGFRVNSPQSIAGPKPASFSFAFPWSITNTIPITLDLVYVASNPSGCSDYTAAEAAQINGKAVLQEWAPVGTSDFPCGSVTRTGKAAAAGAKGVIIRSGQTYLDTAITGSSVIPAVFTSYTIGEQLRTAIQTGPVSVTFSFEYANTQKIIASEYNDTISDFTSRGPQGGPSFLKPDIAAPGQTIFSTSSGSGNKGESLNGTSMAAPHMAGVMALLKQQHPNWTGEELKALAMNTAGNDLFVGTNQTGARYNPVRVGAGRVDVARAVTSTVVAYNAQDEGAVSVSFGAVRILGTQTFTKTIKVSNKGNVARTYGISYNSYTDQPGVDYIFPDGANVTVPPNSSTTVRVVLTANASQMKNIIDPTQERAIPGGGDRYWMAEETGNILLTPNAPGTTLRVPIYASLRPASDIAAAPTSITLSNPANLVTTNLTLQGIGLDTGAPYPTGTLGFTTAYELVHTSPIVTLAPGKPDSSRAADLKYVGVTSDARFVSNPITNSYLSFAIATHKDWNTPASEVEFDVQFDFNNNGTVDAELYTGRLLAGTDDSDAMVSIFYVPSDGSNTPIAYLNGFSPASYETAVFNNNVLAMGVTSDIFETVPEFNSANPRFNFRVRTLSRSAEGQVDLTPWISYDYTKPGVSTEFTAYVSDDGQPVPVAIKGNDLVANSGGVLLFHHHNVEGKTTQVVPFNDTCTLGSSQFLVTKLADDGLCGSLSYAVSQAQASSSLTPTVQFLVSGDVYTLTAPVVITQPVNPLKTITIDGGMTTNNAGFGVARTKLVASGNVPNAMTITANNITVKGFQMTGFSQYAIESWGDNGTFSTLYLYGNGGGIKLGTASDPANNVKLGEPGSKASSNFIYGNTGLGVLVDKGTATANYLHVGYRLDGSMAVNVGGVKVLTGGKLSFGPTNRIAS